MTVKKRNRYHELLARVFLERYAPGATRIPFARAELEAHAAVEPVIELPKNLGDTIYSFRYRNGLPEEIASTQPEGFEWIIAGVGRGRYAFELVKINRILPNPALICIKIPDATPEIVGQYALSDEQALLARVRYNRLIDIFLGITTYSLQNHLRTTVKEIGQIEIDEIYVGVDSHGGQYVIPVQAKGGSDQLSVVQTRQDIECCLEKFPQLRCRAISAQFMAGGEIALFELTYQDGSVRVVEERHYLLTSADSITDEELLRYIR